MNTIILLAGLPGVGKSTISKLISEKLGVKILDLDDFKRVDVDPTLVTSQIDPPTVRWAYYKKAIESAFSIFATSDTSTIIIDEVFHLRELRNNFEALCTQMQIRVFWVEVRCPYSLVEARLRAHSRIGHILSTEEALNMYLLFREIFEDFSTYSKNHIIVDNIDGVDILVDGVLSIIRSG
ncbi:MAG: AAA family ATPase [Candidatus Nomurabacteria bacterium]|nr:AAA family ATPase [Candidatus Nomurabacteria bacterium]